MGTRETERHFRATWESLEASDEPERQHAGGLARANFDSYKRMGVKVYWGWNRGSPTWDEELRAPCYIIGVTDHWYRLKHPGGKVTYVSEPYNVHHEELAQFENEWNVYLGNCLQPIWFPGRTIPIGFTKRETKQPLSA